MCSQAVLWVLSRQASLPTSLTSGMCRCCAQVFVALAQQIKGISKKGKEFFAFNSNLTETITSLFVEDLKIWTSAFALQRVCHVRPRLG